MGYLICTFYEFIKFENEKTKYYDDEKVNISVKVKNSGKAVDKDIKKIKLEYFRCKGEKCNGDEKSVGDDNIKGENLGAGKTKSEDIKFDAPGEENKYLFYACIDTKNVVKESNEGNNCSDKIWMRVHKRPNFSIQSLLLNNGQKGVINMGDSVAVDVIVKNSGGEPFQDVRLAYYLDGQFLEDDNMRHWNLNHNDVKHEDMLLVTPQTPGEHALKVCVDYNNSIRETNESDNCANIQFQVSFPVINCQYFQLVRISDTALTVDYRIDFSSSFEKVGFVGKKDLMTRGSSILYPGTPFSLMVGPKVNPSNFRPIILTKKRQNSGLMHRNAPIVLIMPSILPIGTLLYICFSVTSISDIGCVT